MAVHSVHEEDSGPRKAKRKKKRKNVAVEGSEQAAEDVGCKDELVENSEDIEQPLDASSDEQTGEAKQVSFSEEIETSQYEIDATESGAEDDDDGGGLNASSNFENEGDAREAGTSDRRSRKRKKKAAKQTSSIVESSPKKQAVDKAQSKTMPKRKKRKSNNKP
uniref:Protein MAK11 n=1 Tax=Rhipicephalus zambeziensis TaxID=60191 RepID=A0A224Z6Z9_9ACAR